MVADAGDERARGTRAAAEPPASVEDALARAASHARLAVAETLAAVRALADAAALAASGRPLPEDGALGFVGRSLDELSRGLAAGAEGTRAGLLGAVADALDAEIARWEARAREDADARAVLRAYLGLREILWELGVRPAAAPTRGARRGRSARGRTGGGPRVQRVPVEE